MSHFVLSVQRCVILLKLKFDLISFVFCLLKLFSCSILYIFMQGNKTNYFSTLEMPSRFQFVCKLNFHS